MHPLNLRSLLASCATFSRSFIPFRTAALEVRTTIALHPGPATDCAARMRC